jgi:hypothetical protein
LPVSIRHEGQIDLLMRGRPRRKDVGRLRASRAGQGQRHVIPAALGRLLQNRQVQRVEGSLEGRAVICPAALAVQHDDHRLAGRLGGGDL